MSTTTDSKPKTNGVKKATPNQGKKGDVKKTTLSKSSATATEEAQKIAQVLKPSGKSIVKRIQHAQILADKFEKMSGKYDDLTQFIAGKDAENSTMKFASESGYSFTLSNPATISKILDLVEAEFSKHLEDAENELLNFQIQ